MIRILLVALALGGMSMRPIPAVAAPAMDTVPVDFIDLGPYLSRNRVILVFAPTASDPLYLRQQDAFAGQEAELTDRDLVTGIFTDDTGGTMDETAVSADAVSVLRTQLGLPKGQFAVVLIGKDGGVKLQRTTPVTADTLFALIDAMPMRQSELHRR